MTLMKADDLDPERNPNLIEKYDSALTEIFIRTTDNTFDPYADADETPKIVDMILKTRDELSRNGVEVSVLAVSERFVKIMPNENKKYDLQAAKKSVLRSY